MGAHILAIDDDASILEMLRAVLEGEGGYQVTLAEMVFQNVADVGRLKPDLILLDLLFGSRLLGWDFLQKLKLHRQTMHIPLIICTAAFKEVQEQENILLRKGIPVLYKPFDIDELLDLVKRLLADPAP